MKKLKYITIIVLIAIMCVVLAGCRKNLVTSENPFGLMGMGIRPAGDVMTSLEVNGASVDPRTYSTNQAALAYALYTKANLLDKNASHRAFYSVCPTSNVAMGLDNRVLLNILEIKNGTEFYKIEYRLQDSCPILDIMPSLNRAFELVVTERKYTNTSMTDMKYQKVLNNGTDENGIPFADWTKKITSENQDKPVFHSSQQADYFKSAHVVDMDTIKEASVEYDSEKGVYKISIELDVEDDEDGYNKATYESRKGIREGANDPNAVYTSIIIEIEIWDNGYYKEVKIFEKWEGKTMNLSISSDFAYTDKYSYDIRDCNVSKYYKDGEFINDYNA